MPASLASINAFTLKGKSPKHLAYLSLAVLAAVCSLAGAFLALVGGLRWWWVFVAALGFVRFAINWTTGETMIQPVSFQFLSAGFVRPGFVGPWTLSFSLPLGALLVFLKWRRSRAPSAPVPQNQGPVAA